MVRRLILQLLLAGLVAAGCGGDSDTGGGGDTTDGGGSTTDSLTMIDNEFQPSDLTVASGSTLTVTNDGQAPHTFTTEDGSIDQQVDAGTESSVDITLDAGDYEFHCNFHPEMTGTLTVQ